MFSLFYDTVFPALGGLFGQLSMFASLTWAQFDKYMLGQQLMNGGSPLTYTNLFTGQLVTLSNPPFLLSAAYNFANIVPSFIGMTFGFWQLPVWVGLLIGTLSIYLMLVAIKGLAKFIKGWF